jgi:hypothetical protein
MVVTRSGFTQVVANAFGGMGFAPEAPSIYEFPIEMFLVGSDLTPLNENIDKIVYGLTKWEPKTKAKGVYHVGEMVKITGKDYAEALTNMNLLFLKNLWGDGLPILPATVERVNWILTGTDLPRDTVVGTVNPKGGVASVETIAVSLAMAGGRPEYLPVLIAAIEAFTQPEWKLYDVNATTQSNYPAVIVNGPIATQIRLCSGYGTMGPDPARPAVGPIGRALRLIQQNLGGAVPGIGTMGIYGAGRFTNIVLAEDEDGLPAGWKPLSVERGFAPGTNVVTVVPVEGANNVDVESSTAEDLLRFVPWLKARQTFSKSKVGPNFSPGIVAIGRTMAQTLANDGYTKEKVRTVLWEASQISPSAEQIIFVVAGGAQSQHGYWMQTSGKQQTVVSKEIKLPAKAKWDALLKQAEADLGPLPPPMR